MSRKKSKNEYPDTSMFKAENVGKSKPRKRRTKKVKKEVAEESPVAQYVHPDNKRKNNPPVGMVDPNNDPDQPSKRYSYDPRLDPQLQWSGKTENSEFDIDTVSLHVHERIDPLTIIEKAMKEHKQVQQSLFHYFEMPENNPPLRDAIEFYKHDQNWSNRLIAGDSLLVMNSLLEKEGMEGKVQMIYIDPPYGIQYKSNFQPSFKKLNVIDGKDDDLTQEPEMIKAFRDTWELGTHSYLTHLRKRLILAKRLLTDSGSCFVQISDLNLHYVSILMDEIFGRSNFVRIIQFRKKTMPLGSNVLEEMYDYLVWYTKDLKKIKYHQIYRLQDTSDKKSYWDTVKLSNGDVRKLSRDEKKNKFLLPEGSKLATSVGLKPPSFSAKSVYDFKFNGKTYKPSGCWPTNEDGMNMLAKAGRLIPSGNTLRFLLFLDDFPYSKLTNNWSDTSGVQNKIYPVQTSENVLERCILMTTDTSDLILDPTCGSGTTALVAEKSGRRWITVDSSRISITATRQRLMTSRFDYYELSNPKEGLSTGFKINHANRTSARSIINNDEPEKIPIYNEPVIDKNKIRISGPFTVEAVPSPIVKSIDALSEENQEQTKINTQQEWRDEILRTGIKGKGNQRIEFSSIQTHPTSKWIHAVAETKGVKPKHVAIAFGPEHAPLEQRQVERVFEESQSIQPKPDIIIFAAMQFDPEAAKDIDKKDYSGVTLLKAEMNKDLQTQDLKKKQSTNESFWLMGSPDVECKKQKDGKYIVTVNGFDYYNTKTDEGRIEVESGGASKIAMWSLDTDYDDRSVYPQQIFFPMDGKSGGWNKLAKTLQAYIDEDLITKYQGTESIPFEAGPNKRVAVKIIDARGIESLKIIDLE